VGVTDLLNRFGSDDDDVDDVGTGAGVGAGLAGRLKSAIASFNLSPFK
jgi:hypothetical protein